VGVVGTLWLGASAAKPGGEDGGPTEPHVPLTQPCCLLVEEWLLTRFVRTNMPEPKEK